MIYLLIPTILYCLSGIADAVMDTLTHHYHISIFTKYDEKFWNPFISWRNKYNDGDENKGLKIINIFGIKIKKHVAFTDAWHFFKSIKEVLIGISITSGILIPIEFNILGSLFFLIVIGILRNLIFVLFYKKILLK